MATRKQKEPVAKAMTTDTPERFRLGEIGTLGLNVFNGVSNDELKRELNWPNSIKTYKQMTYAATVNSALTLYENIIGKVDWKYIPPVDATEEDKRIAKIINEMMLDLEGQTWREFITDVLSTMTYGFSVHEKVYRKRTADSGSRYTDGYIGWKKLAIRNQETIEKFIFSPDGSDIIGVKQNLSAVGTNYNSYNAARADNEVVLPRNKFMLFRTGKHKGNPFGVSPLRDAYSAWKYLTAIEELEIIGFSKDLAGIPILSIPPQYMSADASEDQKATYEYYKNVIRNLQQNQQSGVILPNAFDPDTKQPLFKLELLSNEGGKRAFDSDKIKDYYKKAILTTLFADILILGQGETGSFSLGVVKNSMTGAAAESMLKSIVDVLNNDLLLQTFKLNGWDVTRIGTFDFDGLDNTDVESFSKAIQRYSSTGMLERDREVMNAIRVSIGVDALPEDMPVQEDILTGNTSKAGAGMATMGEGTALAPSGEDTSSNNSENVG